MNAPKEPRRFAITSLTRPPAWWGTIWMHRQMELRGLIRDILRRSRGRAFTSIELGFLCQSYEVQEIEAALVGMVADGVVSREGDGYVLPPL